MKTFVFVKRNLKECGRDPVTYIFCLAFPIVMLALFAAINASIPVKQTTFEYTSLIPGVIVFGFSFVSLNLSLLVSKDRKSAFLRRLYVSPLKPADFVFGYAAIGVIVGILQSATCVFSGYILSLITGDGYFTFGAACLLILSQLPELFVCVFVGIFAGAVLSEKSAPAITSAFVSASGILGGAWMPLDIMGWFEKFCEFLPFYPSVKIGRAITGALHSVSDYATNYREAYAFDTTTCLGFLTVFLYAVVFAAFSFFSFSKRK